MIMYERVLKLGKGCPPPPKTALLQTGELVVEFGFGATGEKEKAWQSRELGKWVALFSAGLYERVVLDESYLVT